MYLHQVLGEGARKIGLHPFPFPSARASRNYRGRQPCNDCGLCSGYGCPINAKGSVCPRIESRPIHTSFLQHLPLAFRSYPYYLPLLPWAIEGGAAA